MDSKTYWNRASAFYDTDFWRELSGQCKARDGHRCTTCGKRGRLEAHHVIPRPPVPQPTALDVLGNLITQCTPCHAEVHGRKRGEGIKIFRAPSARRRLR